MPPIDKTHEIRQLNSLRRLNSQRVNNLPRDLPALSPNHAPPLDLQKQYRAKRCAIDLKSNYADRRLSVARTVLQRGVDSARLSSDGKEAQPTRGGSNFTPSDSTLKPAEHTHPLTSLNPGLAVAEDHHFSRNR